MNSRDKDAESTTGQWFSELSRTEPWFKDVVPDVCNLFLSSCLPESNPRK